MNQGRRPLGSGSSRAWAQAVAALSVAVLGMGGVAVAAPGGDPGPPEQAQGNGPPAQQQEAPGQPKRQAPEAGQTSSGVDSHGKTGGGHAKARGEGHAQSGGDGSSGGSGGHVTGQAKKAGGGTSEHGSTHSKAEKVTLCHATGSATNPYVEITISNNGVPAHDRHQNDEDIIPASGGCPGGASGAKEHGNSNE